LDRRADDIRAPLLAGLACYGIWGLSPLVFQAIGRTGADAWEIIGHRAVWGVLWAAVLVLLARQGPMVRAALARPRTMGLLVASTLLIVVNWTLFVWAVNNGRTLETSLGYYLNPLLSMAAGAWLFRERLDGWGKWAIAAAAVGVLLQGLALGALPLISLALAFTFAAYGVIRKRVSVDAQTGLLIECLLILPFGLLYVLWLERTGAGHFTDSPANAFWLLAAGPITVFPLVLFSWAARRLPLSTVGFLQFLAPTLSFTIGVSQGEPLNTLRVLSFVFIWAGAAVYALGAWKRAHALKVEAAPV
jgi:chloramphenicol-sensitive protein RarD